MLRHRVIPVVLLDGYSVVKTIRFDVRRNLGNPIVVARVYNSRNVDELVLLDIDASKERRKIDLQTVSAVAAECFMPLTVGGGISSCADIEGILKAGADKVAMNTALFDSPGLFREAVSVFGSQCIVGSIDVVRAGDGYALHSHSKREQRLGLDEAVRFLTDAGVGEILINDVDRDGSMEGYDCALISRISGLTSVPVIAAGGAGSAQDCVKAVQAGASAPACASIFHFTSITPRLCRETMAAAGIPVRV